MVDILKIISVSIMSMKKEEKRKIFPSNKKNKKMYVHI